MGNRARDEKEFVARLAEFMRYGDSVSSDNTDEILRHLGYDPDLIAKQGKSLADGIFANQMRAERDDLKAKRVAAQRTASDWSPKAPAVAEIDAILSDIRSGKHGSELKVLAFNHNFERATLEDKVSFLKDLGILAKLFPKPKGE